MKTVNIHASKCYCVNIGSGLMPALAQQIKSVCSSKKIALISDTNVFPYYGERTKSALEQNGFQVVSFVFPAGEESKNGSTYLAILNFLAENALTRTDALVALGGGVVGDMTGFVAATYLRGIAYIQIPTTVLAAVDSSVGGKTAIDLPAGKNLAGAFYQPDLVLCDIDLLSNLPEQIFIDGCAEVIKYGILYDAHLFSQLEAQGLNFDREAIITRCVELKAQAVMQDEHDTGLRQKLNLGHTVGHAIERCSNYAISHGQAVAAGTAIIARAAAAHQICSKECTTKIENILMQYGLPTRTDFSTEELVCRMLSDKKRAGSRINLILPTEIGNCIIHPIPVEELKSFIEAGL